MALLDWARPRRWSILVEAVLAAVVALAAWPIAVIGNNEPAAVDVVTAYLEALREGDVERAETFVSDSYGLDADRSWLTAEAMSSDWEIASVERRSATSSTVHAVITSGGERAEGAFALEGSEDDPLIANPYMYVTNANPLFASLEIGGVRGEVGAADGQALPVALYPGSYSLFASVPEFSGEDGLSVLAMPGSAAGGYSADAIDLNALMTGPLTGSEAIESRLNEAIAAWLDGCAESADLAPAGCPFSAASDYGVAYDGRNEFTTVDELDWAVETYPRVRFDRDLRLEVVQPGWMTLSGTGTATHEDGETTVAGRCGVGFDYVSPAIGADGDITVALTDPPGNTCF